MGRSKGSIFTGRISYRSFVLSSNRKGSAAHFMIPVSEFNFVVLLKAVNNLQGRKDGRSVLFDQIPR